MASYLLILVAAFAVTVTAVYQRAIVTSTYSNPGYGGYGASYGTANHQMPGYGVTGHGAMYNSPVRAITDHVHTHDHHAHSDHCSCSVGEVCKQDRHGHPFCQPNGLYSHYNGAVGVSNYGSGRGGQCMYLEYPTQCLRPRIPGAITRYTFQNGRCMPMVASNVATWCRPQGMYNNIFRSYLTCQKACMY